MVARVVYKFKSKQPISYMIFWSVYMAQDLPLVCITLAKFCSQKKVYCQVKSPIFIQALFTMQTVSKQLYSFKQGTRVSK